MLCPTYIDKKSWKTEFTRPSIFTEPNFSPGEKGLKKLPNAPNLYNKKHVWKSCNLYIDLLFSWSWNQTTTIVTSYFFPKQTPHILEDGLTKFQIRPLVWPVMSPNALLVKIQGIGIDLICNWVCLLTNGVVGETLQTWQQWSHTDHNQYIWTLETNHKFFLPFSLLLLNNAWPALKRLKHEFVCNQIAKIS